MAWIAGCQSNLLHLGMYKYVSNGGVKIKRATSELSHHQAHVIIDSRKFGEQKGLFSSHMYNLLILCP
jgi:hypothetical protein